MLGRHRKGIFEAAARLGERDRDLTKTRAEVAWMGEVSRRSGRPVSFGLVQSNRRPDLYQRVIEMAKEENESGAVVRPQTTARGIGVIYNVANRTPWDGNPTWKELRKLGGLAARLDAIADPDRRARLIAEGTEKMNMSPEDVFVLPEGDARYDCLPEHSLASVAGAPRREPGGSVPRPGDGDRWVGESQLPDPEPELRRRARDAHDPVITLGLADAGAHVGQIMDSSQPTFLLTHWVRDRGRWTLEEAIRRLTSDTADLFGITDRGRLVPGGYADVNVIDFENLRLPQPEYVNDLPNDAGRYVQGSSGYDYTIVNGQVFMDHGEHAGAFAGQTLRS